MKIVVSVHEGFQNVPKLYGSEVREPGEVTDFKSGLREAGKVGIVVLGHSMRLIRMGVICRVSFMDIMMV